MGKLAIATPRWLRTLRYAIAVIVAALAVAIPMLRGMLPWTAAALLPAAVGYALLVGLPAALILKARGWSGPALAAAAGALVGGGPIGLMVLFAGWPIGALLYVAIGAVAGLVAWIILRLQSFSDRIPRVQWTPHLRLLNSPVVAAIAVFLLAHELALVRGPKDMSCHNVFRNGGRSISVVQTATVKVTEEDWPRLQAALSAAAASGGWSVRDFTRPQVLGLSMCQEVGTNLSIQQWTWTDPPWPAVTIAVASPQGGDAWREPVDAVLRRIEQEWPGAVETNSPAPFVESRSGAVAQKQPSR